MLKKIIVWVVFVLGLLLVGSYWYSGLYDTSNASGVYKNISTFGALFGVYFVLWQILLISRARWLDQIFGFDKLSVLHKWGGFTTTILVLVHGVFIAMSFYTIGRSRFLLEYIGEIFSVVLFVVIAVISMGIVIRKMKYEAWYFVHLLTYVAIVIAFEHQLEDGHDFRENASFAILWIVMYVFAFANLLYYRFIRPAFYFLKYDFKVSKVVRETSDSVSVYISSKRISEFRNLGGQFVFLHFLQSGFWTQAHPFSISSKGNSEYLRITVKNLGDYSGNMHLLKEGTRIIVDGPLGVFTKKVLNNKKALLIAGGVGISPVYSLACDLVGDGVDVGLIYSTKESSNVILKAEVEALFSGDEGNRLILMMTGDDAWSGEKGRPDVEKIRRLFPDFMERDIYVCGPVPMIDAVVSGLRGISFPKKQLHFEKFTLGR